MRAAVWVVVTPAARQPEPVTAEMLGEARRLAGPGGEVHALIVGHELERATAGVAPWGTDGVLVVEQAHLSSYHPERYADAVAQAVRAENPRAVLFAGTVLGRDLGGRVAVELERRFHGGCLNFEFAGEDVQVTRSVDGGRQHQMERAGGPPFLLSLVPDTVGAGAPAPPRTLPVRALDVVPRAGAEALRDLGFAAADPRTMDLVDADVIVAGGRGMGGHDQFMLLAELADRLGGSVGASRPAVEAGWAPYERQVGQTGRTVRPKLYIACGISGASQHLAGMRSAKVIVAINTDANAPIFDVATLAVEGDAAAVLAELLEQLRRRQQKAAA